MEDNYFDKKLKDILEDPPIFEPDAGAIVDMKRRLEATKSKKQQSVFGLGWLIPLLLLPFLFGSIFFFIKYKNLNQKLDDITLQLNHFQKDTNTHNYVTYHYDTIYKVIYKDIIVERTYENASPSPPILSHYYQNGSLFSNLSNAPYLTEFGRLGLEAIHRPQSFRPSGLGFPGLFSDKGGMLEEKEAEIFMDWTKRPLKSLDYLSVNPLKSYSYSRYFQLEEKLNDPKWEYRKPKVNPVNYFIPKGINVGGQSMPIVKGKAKGKSYSGNNIGFTAALEFHKGVELQFGLERLAIGFELKDESSIVGYPLASPENPGDFFKEMYVDLSYLKIPIIFKKYLRKDKDFTPFLGIGLVAQKPLKQKFDYEYINGITGEYNLNQSFSDGSFLVNNLRANIGVRYHFWKQFSAQSELVYHHSKEQGSGEYFKLRYWALNMGLKYHFN